MHEERVNKNGILEVREEDRRVINFLEKPDPKVINYTNLTVL
jgi:NDP-sugar pyrophosphorylase family protein